MGGGCIEFDACVGESDMPSSIVGSEPGMSAIGDSSERMLTYFGVGASDEPGGDIIRGRWKLPLPGCPLAA